MSNESKTSHAVATNLSELELKKILIDKMKRNKSIYKSDEQKNLYKALVDAYESDRLLLDTYGDTVSFKRRRDDEDKDEEPSTRSNRGSKRRRAGKEPESTSAPKEKTSKTSGKSYKGSKSQHKTAGESAQTEEPMHTTKDLEEPAHQEFKTGVTKDQPMKKPLNSLIGFRDQQNFLLSIKEDPHESFNELMDTPLDFSAFVMNQLKVDTLTPELLTGLTFELMKGSRKSLVELNYLFEEVYKATTDQLDWNNPEECGVKCRESALDVYSKCRIIAVTKLEIVDWHNYKHLDWITVHRDDDKLHVEDLQLGVESYQKKPNLTKPDTYRSDLKRREVYIAYFNPKGFIYQNKDKKNRLMRIDELHKFSDGTLNDVRTALNDRLKGIRMEHLPLTIWRQSDKDKTGAMIQAIDKQLKTRRIMRSLEKFIGGRPYEDKMDSVHSTLSMYYDYGAHVKGELLVVRNRYSNPMIHPEQERSTQGYPLDSVEVLRFYTLSGNPVKEILLKLNLPDHRILKDGGEVLTLKNFKKDAALKLFKSTNQERYEHVGPEVISSQDGIVYKNAKRDYAWLMVSRCSRSHIHLQIK
ncbi:hypothetical protein Tco_0941551 [Tanacetum coccineum]|uniref:Uncharacterized protein n=1 Tax=Tanacetum coccineum TaxID=301880 RepID=A0ABQ5DTS3_9ASTR